MTGTGYLIYESLKDGTFSVAIEGGERVANGFPTIEDARVYIRFLIRERQRVQPNEPITEKEDGTRSEL